MKVYTEKQRKPDIPAQKMELLTEKNNLYRATLNRNSTWKMHENGNYMKSLFQPNASKILGSDFVKPNNAPDEQNRIGNTHTKEIREPHLENVRHPTFMHPYVKPQDSRNWFSDGKVHTLPTRFNFNANFLN